MAFKSIHRKSVIGDAYSNTARGAYTFEFEVPNYRWGATEENGELMRKYALDMLEEVYKSIDADARRYGVTRDEYVATLAYEIQADGTDEKNSDGSPSWSRGRSGIPLFNKHRHRVDISANELVDRMAALGENDILSAIQDQQVATKYENRYMRPKRVILRLKTEEFSDMISEHDVVEEFQKDTEVFNVQFDKVTKRRKSISKRKKKEKIEREKRELRNKRRRELYHQKKAAKLKQKKVASQKPRTEKKVKDASGRTIGTWKLTAAGWRYLKNGKWTTPTPLAMKRKPRG